MRRLFWKSTKKKHPTRTIRNRLRIETLERRDLLAGNVTAVLQGPNLIITGDNDHNGVEISQVVADRGVGTDAPAPPGLYVEGLDWSGNPILSSGKGTLADSATTINGDTGPAIFQGVQNVIIKMKRGDDLVVISNDTDALHECFDFIGSQGDGDSGIKSFINGGVDIPGFVKANMGRDHDVFAIGPHTTIGSFLDVTTGHGMDAIGICQSHIGGNFFADTGKHDDFVAIDPDVLVPVGGVGTDGPSNGIEILGSTIALNAIIETGGGNDGVSIAGNLPIFEVGSDDSVRSDIQPEPSISVQIGLNLQISTGNGHDDVFIGPEIVDEDGTDDVGSDNTLEGFPYVDVGLNATINTGGGHDDVSASYIHTGLNFIAQLGGGHDDLILSYAIVGVKGAGSVIINAGSGHDDVEAEDLEIATHFIAQLGSGNDCLKADGIESILFQANGGSGTDGRDIEDITSLVFQELNFEEFCDDE